jgi:hypothetical protein
LENAVKLLLAMALGLLALVALAVGLAYRRLKRLADSPAAADWMESLDGGLAIPMRDCDTRRTPKEKP